MPREAFDVKARRYLVEGRLDVRHVVGDVIVAFCRGDSGGALQAGLRSRWLVVRLSRQGPLLSPPSAHARRPSARISGRCVTRA
jgi:hypothetical protein